MSSAVSQVAAADRPSGGGVELASHRRGSIGGDGLLQDELEVRWAELVSAVAAEFDAHQQGRPDFDHNLSELRLRAKRRGRENAQEWFQVAIRPAELLGRPAQQLAREFYQGFYACT